jgi:hypothetical protein
MHAVVPDAKLIYVVRNPIQRVVSHYIMSYASGTLNGPIEDALRDFESNPMNQFVCRSLYAMQLEQYLEYYPPNRILVIAQEDLYARRRETLQRVFRYLGVDEGFASPKFRRVLHKSSSRRRRTRVGTFVKESVLQTLTAWIPRDQRFRVDQILLRPFSMRVAPPVLDPVFRTELADFFRQDVARLRALTGESFADWRF